MVVTDPLKGRRVSHSKLELTFPLTIFTDGAAKGVNGQGPASSAFIVRARGGRHIFTRGVPIGVKTNNVAEYAGLLMALDWMLKEVPKKWWYVHFKTDSELMVKQLTGIYGVKHAVMKEMFNQVQDRLVKLGGYKIEWIPRTQNSDADKACNDALKQNGITIDERDSCFECKGIQGGIPGNENVINDRNLCDYCHADKLEGVGK